MGPRETFKQTHKNKPSLVTGYKLIKRIPESLFEEHRRMLTVKRAPYYPYTDGWYLIEKVEVL